ncbi:MAG: hypothetical protein Q8Q09_23395 [Deltaproteobacteria bacterium]|nr:hypothetical protein [Deltaproteobacteria bacterium]
MARVRGVERRPDISASAVCAPSITAAIDRLRHGTVTLHGEPICSEDYDGEWAAVFATGIAREASEFWVVISARGRVEYHRVLDTPVGVRVTAMAMHRGLVAITGRSLATLEMPEGAEALINFAVPFGGDPSPRSLELDPMFLPLIGVTDRAELSARLAVASGDSESPTAASVRPLLSRAADGPRGLIGVLPATQSIPVLRAWQRGVYERVADLHAQLDPTNGRVMAAYAVAHSLVENVNCDEGWRCVQLPPAAATVNPMVVSSSAMFKRGTATVVLAALLEQPPRPATPAPPTSDHFANGREDHADDRAIAASIALDPIEGPISGGSRGAVRFVAFTTRVGDRRATAVYVVAPDRAPRRFEVEPLSAAAVGVRTVMVRDIDGNHEPEILVESAAGQSHAIGVATLFWPPTVTDRNTFTRLDAMRQLVETESLADLDRGLRGFAPSPFESAEQMCAVVERLSASTGRQLAAQAPSNGAMVIRYNQVGFPLQGAQERMSTAQLRSASDAQSVLGPFAGATCAQLSCDPPLGYCKLATGGRESGYLWLGPRRAQPFWGVSLLASGRR